jgi:ABC-type proline/glycine betaine transport system ATPase subunit
MRGGIFRINCPAAWRSARHWRAASPANPRSCCWTSRSARSTEVTRTEIQHLLLKAVRETAAILITHDINEALLLSDRILLLGGSPARQSGEWVIDLPKPKEDYVAELGTIRIRILTTLRSATRQKLNEGQNHVYR